MARKPSGINDLAKQFGSKVKDRQKTYSATGGMVDDSGGWKPVKESAKPSGNKNETSTTKKQTQRKPSAINTFANLAGPTVDQRKSRGALDMKTVETGGGGTLTSFKANFNPFDPSRVSDTFKGTFTSPGGRSFFADVTRSSGSIDLQGAPEIGNFNPDSGSGVAIAKDDGSNQTTNPRGGGGILPGGGGGGGFSFSGDGGPSGANLRGLAAGAAVGAGILYLMGEL